MKMNLIYKCRNCNHLFKESLTLNIPALKSMVLKVEHAQEIVQEVRAHECKNRLPLEIGLGDLIRIEEMI